MKKEIQTVAAGSLYITIFTLLSKGLGFFREVLTANLFGTSWQMDAVVIALSPARIITSIISAGLISVFVPQYIKIRKRYRRFSKICLVGSCDVWNRLCGIRWISATLTFLFREDIRSRVFKRSS